MCKVLKVSRSLIYYKYKARTNDYDIEEDSHILLSRTANIDNHS